MPDWLGEVAETRLDINPSAKPHIVASMLAMGDIGQFDIVYCSHALEHLYPHEVGVALGEFRRVLNPGGVAVVVVPDLQDARPTADVLVQTPAGPITGLDLFYGFAPWLKENPHMAHHTGFVEATLRKAMTDAGFGAVMTQRCNDYNLMGFARADSDV